MNLGTLRPLETLNCFETYVVKILDLLLIEKAMSLFRSSVCRAWLRLPVTVRPLSTSVPCRVDLDVGEIEGVEFKVKPLRRIGEDGNTMRARLLC